MFILTLGVSLALTINHAQEIEEMEVEAGQLQGRLEGAEKQQIITGDQRREMMLDLTAKLSAAERKRSMYDAQYSEVSLDQ